MLAGSVSLMENLTNDVSIDRGRVNNNLDNNDSVNLAASAENIDDFHGIRIDYSRDARLTDFGKATLADRYLMPGENIFLYYACVFP